MRKLTLLEPTVGEIADLDNARYLVVADAGCMNCDLKGRCDLTRSRSGAVNGDVICNANVRSDRTPVAFRRLKKLDAAVFTRPDCPDWAKFAAVTENGSVMVCAKPMTAGACGGWSAAGCAAILDGRCDPRDWRESQISRERVSPKPDDADKNKQLRDALDALARVSPAIAALLSAFFERARRDCRVEK